MDQHFLRLAYQAYRFPYRAHYCLQQTPIDNLTACHYWLNRIKRPTAQVYWTQAQLCVFENNLPKAFSFFEKAERCHGDLTAKEASTLHFIHRFWQGYLHPQASSPSLLRQLQTYLDPSFYQTALENVDAILVLGHRLNMDGTPSAQLLERLNCTHHWAQAFPEAKVLLSGKGHHRLHTEANIMATYLMQQDLDPHRIILEDRSMNTLENAQYSLPLCKNAKRRLIVTDWAHQPRAQIIFHLTQQKRPNGEVQFWGRSPHIESYFDEQTRLNSHIDALRAFGFAGFYCPPYSAF